MAGPKRTAAQREVVLAQVVFGITCGRTHAAIAEEMGVARSQVSYDWAQAKKHIQQAWLNNGLDWISGEIAKIEAAQALVMECWLGTMQPTAEKEWVGPTPLSEDEMARLAVIADAEPEIAKALGDFGQGHWRPAKLNPAKPAPGWALAWNALEGRKCEMVGVLKARQPNDGTPELPVADALPKAAEINSLEDASAVLREMEERLGGGRVLKYAKRGATG